MVVEQIEIGDFGEFGNPRPPDFFAPPPASS